MAVSLSFYKYAKAYTIIMSLRLLNVHDSLRHYSWKEGLNFLLSLLIASDAGMFREVFNKEYKASINEGRFPAVLTKDAERLNESTHRIPCTMSKIAAVTRPQFTSNGNSTEWTPIGL